MSRSSISMYNFGGSPLCPSLTDPDLYVKLQWVATLYFTIFVGSTRDTPGCNDFPDFPSGTQDAFGGENLGGPCLESWVGALKAGVLITCYISTGHRDVPGDNGVPCRWKYGIFCVKNEDHGQDQTQIRIRPVQPCQKEDKEDG